MDPRSRVILVNDSNKGSTLLASSPPNNGATSAQLADYLLSLLEHEQHDPKVEPFDGSQLSPHATPSEITSLLPPPLLPQTSLHSLEVREELKCKEILQDIAYHLMLMVLVSPNAMNAFSEEAGIKPADINADWWNNLPYDTKREAIVAGLFNLGVNVFVQRNFIPQALKSLREGFGKCLNSPPDFSSNTLTLIASLTAAFAFSAMSYEAFLWLGAVAAVLPGLASLVTSFTTRYPSVEKAKKRIRLFFDKDMRFQREIANTLRHLNQSYVAILNNLIKEKHYKLHGKDLNLLLAKFAKDTQNLSLTCLLAKKTKQELLQEYGLVITENGFAACMASTAFQTFTQKGFDGANAIAHLGGSSLKGLSTSEQFFIGATGGAVSGVLYWLSALNFIPAAIYVTTELASDLLHGTKKLVLHPINTVRETYHNPRGLVRFSKFSLAVVANWYASKAMTGVGRGIVKNVANIFRSTTLSWGFYAKIFPLLNGLGGLAINFTATINELRKNEQEEARKNPKLHDVAKYLEETPLPVTIEVEKEDLPLPRMEEATEYVSGPAPAPRTETVSTLAHFREFSLFAPANSHWQQVEMANRRPRVMADDEEENLALPLLENLDPEQKPANASTWSRVRSSCSIM